MYKKISILIFAGIVVSIISFALFISWLSLGGCPPSYWIETEVITETTSPTTNITRNDLPSSSVLRTILIDIVENTSLNNIHKEVTHIEWNTTKSMLEASSITPVDSNENIWTGYVYFEDVLVHIQLLIMVC